MDVTPLRLDTAQVTVAVLASHLVAGRSRAGAWSGRESGVGTGLL